MVGKNRRKEGGIAGRDGMEGSMTEVFKLGHKSMDKHGSRLRLADRRRSRGCGGRRRKRLSVM